MKVENAGDAHALLCNMSKKHKLILDVDEMCLHIEHRWLRAALSVEFHHLMAPYGRVPLLNEARNLAFKLESALKPRFLTESLALKPESAASCRSRR